MLCFSILNAINFVNASRRRSVDDDLLQQETRRAGVQCVKLSILLRISLLVETFVVRCVKRVVEARPVQTMTAIIMGLETSLENDQLSRAPGSPRFAGHADLTLSLRWIRSAYYYLSLVLLA